MSRRSKRGGGGGGHEGADERWLLTYADMITLLLALFIVLFAMSSIDAKQFDNVRRSLSQTFKGQVIESPGAIIDGSTGAIDPVAANERAAATVVTNTEQSSDAAANSAAQYEQKQQEIKDAVEASNLGAVAVVEPTQRGIVITLAGDALFESGSAEIKPEMKNSLRQVAREIGQFGRAVSIEGHTDGAPLNGNSQFIDNLDLSSKRANNVLRYLIDEGVLARRLHSEGYGEWKPLVDPPTPTASVSANRRVEIVLLAPGAETGNQVEKSGGNGDVQVASDPNPTNVIGGIGTKAPGPKLPRSAPVIDPIVDPIVDLSR